MFGKLCNEFCIRMGKFAQQALGQVARWSAAKAGLKVIATDTALLPEGCRAIPKHFYDVNPAVLNHLKDGNRAILHQKMRNWQASNEQTGKHWFNKDDQWGTKSDPKYWHKEVFPFLNLRTVKKMIADLVDDALLVVDGDWCQPVKAFSGAEQLTLDFGKEFQQPGKVFHSSIQRESNSSKSNTPKQTPKRARAGIRKDAVADFPLPETRNHADVEMHEHRDIEGEGHDELFGLPTALIEGWTDTHVSLESFIARYGKDAINQTWPNVQGFDKPIAGLRTLLAKSPTPSSAPPPSPADTTENEIDVDETPDIDIAEWVKDQFALLETKPESALCVPSILPDAAKWWETAYSQLAIQLDRASFETWLRDVQLVEVEGSRWVFTAANQYAADMLNHRLNRELCRVLSDVTGIDRKQLELHFEVKAVQRG